MDVIITVNTGDARHANLEQKIWEAFPSIGGIEKVAISFRQYTLSFPLEQEDPEKMRKFLQNEGVSFNFKAL